MFPLQAHPTTSYRPTELCAQGSIFLPLCLTARLLTSNPCLHCRGWLPPASLCPLEAHTTTFYRPTSLTTHTPSNTAKLLTPNPCLHHRGWFPSTSQSPPTAFSNMPSTPSWSWVRGYGPGSPPSCTGCALASPPAARQGSRSSNSEPGVASRYRLTRFPSVPCFDCATLRNILGFKVFFFHTLRNILGL